MTKLATILVLLIGILHVWIMILEMYFWARPLGRKAFRLSPEQAESTKVLAMNQGLYNGFLAAGLIWGAFSQMIHLQVFFLACVAIAGIFGALTVGKKILFIQTVPAIIALFFVLWS